MTNTYRQQTQNKHKAHRLACARMHGIYVVLLLDEILNGIAYEYFMYLRLKLY